MLRLGRIARPHGVRGAVAVTLDNPASETLLEVDYVHLRDGGASQRYEVRSARPGRKGQIVLRLEGIDSVEAAETLRDRELLVEESQLPRLDPDEFWNRQLLGLRAMDREGQDLGEVIEVVDTAEIPVLVVRGESGERYVPFTRSHLDEVDLAAGRIVVDPPEELT